jgi:hypothetical protein
MTRSSAAEFPLIGHPEPGDTEIRTLLPSPKDSKVSRVIVV